MNQPPLIIFEMANNHMGDVEHGKLIIREFVKIAHDFGNTFAFAMKFQLRDLDTFIHPDYKDRMDLKYVKRFSETRLTKIQLAELVQLTEDSGMFSICTGFDEPSIDTIEEMEFDYIKIASCSFTDWPLLHRIAKSRLPIIASTGGASKDDIDRVVSFFIHRNKDLSLLHCMGEYPTPVDHAQLNQINFLKQKYPELRVGWSTHDEPGQMLTSGLAIAKGAEIIEKHVAVETDQYKPNAYSITPDKARFWLANCKVALEACGIKDDRHISSPREQSDLRQFKRGVFANRDVKAGESITRDDVFYAWPVEDDGVTTNEMSKYVNIIMDSDVSKGQPITKSNAKITDTRANVWEIVQKVKSFLKESKVVFPGHTFLEISHHYGIEKFYQYGITMLVVVNREYCKKIIVVLPGQEHPEQYHRIKEESFLILHGKLNVEIDRNHKIMETGDFVTIHPEQRHSFKSDDGCIIEELSSNHNPQDSFYTDPLIQENRNRKTIVNHWL